MTRRSLAEILQSVSVALFPDRMGDAPVAVDSRDVDGDTALHVIVRRGELEGVRVLLDAGANPDAIGDMGETPLHIAVGGGHREIAAALMAAGAHGNIVSEFGQSAAGIAKASGNRRPRSGRKLRGAR